ncbi:MAG: hypothetical protein ABIL07_02645, partial [candidate division WOR-3 bacterium]
KNIIFKIDEFVEVAIPLDYIGTIKDYIEFIIKAREAGKEIDRTPLLRVILTQKDIILKNWTV